jgi:hypothetical protein
MLAEAGRLQERGWTRMRVEIGDDHSLVVYSDTWKARLMGAFFPIFSAVPVWDFPSNLPLVWKFFLWAFAAISIILGATLMLAPMVGTVRIQREDGQVCVYWKSPLRSSVEQIQTGEVSSIDIVEHRDEEGEKTYSVQMGLMAGRRLYLASGLKQRPVVPAYQIRSTLGLTGRND